MMFSIIVPVYKVEKYLSECVESILAQEYKEFELILVDDGSPDNCPQMCEQFSEDDSRIVVIHQQNAGLSAARNSGLNRASGDYIVFVDSDDVLYPGALNQLVDIIQANKYPELIIGNVINWDGEKEKLVVDNAHFMKQQESKDLFEICELYAHKGAMLPWRAYQSVYKRKWLECHKLRFDESNVGAEDCEFFNRIIEYVQTYQLTNISMVRYRVAREGSIINAPSFKSVLGQLVVFEKVFAHADRFHNQQLMKNYYADRFTNIIILISLLKNENERKQCVKFVEQKKEILNYTSDTYKYNFSKMIWKMFGFEKGSNILLTINKFRSKK